MLPAYTLPTDVLHPATGTEAPDRKTEPDAAEDQPVAEVAGMNASFARNTCAVCAAADRAERDVQTISTVKQRARDGPRARTRP